MLISFRNSKRGQVGETVTWAVATVIILVVLLISIFLSGFYFEDLFRAKPVKTGDFSASTSFFSWLLTEDSGGVNVYGQLKSEDDLNEFNGPLAVSVLKEPYTGPYWDIWVGTSEGTFFPYKSNEYFGSEPAVMHVDDLFSETVLLDQNKLVSMIRYYLPEAS